MAKGNDAVGKAAEIAPFDASRPDKRFFPFHPSSTVVAVEASVNHVAVLAAGYTTVSAIVMARAMISGPDSTHKTPSKTLHKLFNAFAVLLSRCTVGLGSVCSQDTGEGRCRRGSGGEMLDRCPRLSGSRTRSCRTRSFDSLRDERVDTTFAEVTQERVGDVETGRLATIHKLGDAHPSACCSSENLSHFHSASVGVLVF